jgi:hypothetical protein
LSYQEFMDLSATKTHALQAVPASMEKPRGKAQTPVH